LRIGERCVVKRAVLLSIPPKLVTPSGIPADRAFFRVYVHNPYRESLCGARATIVGVVCGNSVKEKHLDKFSQELALSGCAMHGVAGHTSWREFPMVSNASMTIGKELDRLGKQQNVVDVAVMKTFVLGVV
jgi:hypothetical protein